MNLDILHPDGRPDPALLSGIPYVRLLYNVSRGTGSQDFSYAFSQYNPYLVALQAAGKKVIFILGHQTWGEGVQGWPRWEDFTPATWAHFTNVFAETVIHNVVQRFVGRGVIWQLWNEPDSKDARASVLMPAASYGHFFRTVSERIKAIDPSATVITAGLNSGPASAYKYFKDAAIAPDGIALHEYGRGAAKNRNYRPFGTIEESLHYWKLRTNIPIWLTEFGVLDQPNEPEDKVAGYARDFVAAARHGGVNRIAWYAFGRMDNGYGVIAPNGQIRDRLLDALKYDAGGGTPTPNPDSRGYEITNIPGRLRFRAAPTQSAQTYLLLSNGDVIKPTDETVVAENYRWRKIIFNDVTGWIAVRGGNLSIEVKL